MKFSIRELLLVKLSVALTLGWWIDRRQLAVDLAEERDFHQSLFEIDKSELKQDPGWTATAIWGEPRLRIGDY